VDDCTVNPAHASGQDNVRPVPVTVISIGGRLVINSWSGPNAAVAAISAAERPTL
jgi:hypothetical protein